MLDLDDLGPDELSGAVTSVSRLLFLVLGWSVLSLGKRLEYSVELLRILPSRLTGTNLLEQQTDGGEKLLPLLRG